MLKKELNKSLIPLCMAFTYHSQVYGWAQSCHSFKINEAAKRSGGLEWIMAALSTHVNGDHERPAWWLRDRRKRTHKNKLLQDSKTNHERYGNDGSILIRSCKLWVTFKECSDGYAKNTPWSQIFWMCETEINLNWAKLSEDQCGQAKGTFTASWSYVNLHKVQNLWRKRLLSLILECPGSWFTSEKRYFNLHIVEITHEIVYSHD